MYLLAHTPLRGHPHMGAPHTIFQGQVKFLGASHTIFQGQVRCQVERFTGRCTGIKPGPFVRASKFVKNFTKNNVSTFLEYYSERDQQKSIIILISNIFIIDIFIIIIITMTWILSVLVALLSTIIIK